MKSIWRQKLGNEPVYAVINAMICWTCLLIRSFHLMLCNRNTVEYELSRNKAHTHTHMSKQLIEIQFAIDFIVYWNVTKICGFAIFILNWICRNVIINSGGNKVIKSKALSKLNQMNFTWNTKQPNRICLKIPTVIFKPKIKSSALWLSKMLENEPFSNIKLKTSCCHEEILKLELLLQVIIRFSIGHSKQPKMPFI